MTRRCPWKKRSTPPSAAPPPQQGTASRRPASLVRGEHEFHIVGYNARADDAHYSILSGAFEVGGYTWALDCSFDDDGHLASISLMLLTAYITEEAVVAKASLRIEDPLGRWPAAVWESDEAYTFHVWSGNSWQLSQAGRSWTLSLPEAFRGHEGRYMEDDHLTILCTVEVLRQEGEDSGIAQDMHKLLFLPSESESKTESVLESKRRTGMLPDVTFLVEQDEIQAHRLVLAMRSPVFAAELLGGMKESTTSRVMVDDMSASTFRAMMRFIYTDKLPIKAATINKRVCKEKHVSRRRVAMALDLLVAADRYDLEKLRLMCEKMLSESIDVASVMPTLMVVHGRHNCRQLEASCIDYLASDVDVYASVKETEEYKELEESCCSFLVNVADKVATCKLVDDGANTNRCWPEKRSVSTYNTLEVVRGVHELRIPNFNSLRTSYGVSQIFNSDTFQIGGYDWKLEVWMMEGSLSVCAELLTDPGTAGVRVSLCFRTDVPSGKSLPITGRMEEIFTEGDSWGFRDFFRLEDLVSPYLAHDGSLTIHCDLVITNKAYTTSTSDGVEDMTLAPPPNIASHLEQLLVSEKGSDVTFLVEKREIHAHSLIIAMRSPALYMVVVAANKEEDIVVPVKDMKAAVFKVLLHFIYTGELPPLEDIALAAGDGVMTTAGDMLAAASRFQLDMMKDKCETLFGQSVSKQNGTSMLKLARHHNCMKLKDYCLKFE